MVKAPRPGPSDNRSGTSRIRAQYGWKSLSRPSPRQHRGGLREDFRLFLCGRCRQQVRICSGCDRGQIYCGSTCSRAARRMSLQAAGSRYQATRPGRVRHAQRQADYRRREGLRKRKVTHQGSRSRWAASRLATRMILPSKLTSSKAISRADPSGELVRCDFCEGACRNFARAAFLRRRKVARTLRR